MRKRASEYTALGIFSFVIGIYIFLSYRTRFFYSAISPFPYYNYLLEAFLHGRTYILSPPNILDLSLFHNRYYPYWGPAPVLFIAPFYLFAGATGASDYIYGVTAGIINIAIFYLVLKEFISFSRLVVRKSHIYLLSLGFALSSPNLYCALNGGVWQTSQAIGMTYLLFGLLFFFKFFNKNNHTIYLILSVLFINLAWLSRFGMAFYLLFFGYAIILLRKKTAIVKKILITVIPITAISLCVFFSYNYVRFGSIFDVGTRYMVTDINIATTPSDLAEMILLNVLHREGNQYSLANIPRGIHYYFLNPVKFSTNQPYIITDSMGNGIFFIYPILCLLFGLFLKNSVKLDKKNKYFLFVVSAISALYMANLLIYIGTGYHQVGNRYIFDIFPLLLLAILYCIERISPYISWSLLLYGAVINIAGVMAYYLGRIYF